MSNLAIGKSTTQKELSTVKTVSQNVNNQANFGTVIDQQTSQPIVTTPQKKFSRSDVILPCDTTLVDSNAKGSMELEGEIINLVNAHVFKVKPRTHEENVNFLQKDLGITRATAEEILRPMLPEPVQTAPTHQEEKSYLMSKQVDAVARDAEGNIIARIFKMVV